MGLLNGCNYSRKDRMYNPVTRELIERLFACNRLVNHKTIENSLHAKGSDR